MHSPQTYKQLPCRSLSHWQGLQAHRTGPGCRRAAPSVIILSLIVIVNITTMVIITQTLHHEDHQHDGEITAVATWVQVPSAWQILVALPKSWNPGWQSYEIWCKDAVDYDVDLHGHGHGHGVDRWHWLCWWRMVNRMRRLLYLTSKRHAVPLFHSMDDVLQRRQFLIVFLMMLSIFENGSGDCDVLNQDSWYLMFDDWYYQLNWYW